MKYSILLTTTALCSVLLANAQKAPQKAYAITGATKGSFVWTEVKQIDLGTGEVSQSIFDNQQSAFTVMSARTGKSIPVKDAKGGVANATQLPFATYSAACAFDKEHNRLYYTPMFLNELRYVDLDAKTPTMYYFEGESFSSATNLNDEANHITRMAIGADGQGYGLSNDGNHLVKFTTGRKPVIADLGAIEDDGANPGVSIHTKPASWGGDMVADALGNLYVVSASRLVFKVDISTRKATYVASINEIPSTFTTNGAAVVEDDKLIVSSANSTEGYYEVDMNTWKATKVANGGSVFNASDLANGNLAFESKKVTTIPYFIRNGVVLNNKITVYPNPVVTKGSFRVAFHAITGRHDVQLVDISGRVVSQKMVNVVADGQVAEVPVSAKLTKGMYLVKVVGGEKKTVYADMLLIAD
jgi:hypothetical protein